MLKTIKTVIIKFQVFFVQVEIGRFNSYKECQINPQKFHELDIIKTPYPTSTIIALTKNNY